MKNSKHNKQRMCLDFWVALQYINNMKILRALRGLRGYNKTTS